MALLRYGNDLQVQIELADGVLPDGPGMPRGEPLRDLDAATTAALAEPLDYPPLAQSTTPSDRIVLALDHGTPQAAQVTATVIHNLVTAGVDPDGITVLRCPADSDAGTSDPCRLLDETLRERITLLAHDPTDRKQLAFLAVDKSGEAILINRALHEADVVLSVGCLHGDEAAGYFGIHGSVYPTFSDAKTIHRFRGFGSLDGRGARKRELVADVERAAWQLGILFTIQLVPGPGEQVLHVLAGQSDSVVRRGRELYREAWSWPDPRQVSLAVAAIEGGPDRQTWENVGRALQVARNFVDEDGTIVICSDLAARPGPAMQMLVKSSSRESALRHVSKQRPVDALPAAQLARVLDRNKVYLLSRLDPSVVEELEMIPIAGPEELARLALRYPSCVLLSNAPNITVADQCHA